MESAAAPLAYDLIQAVLSQPLQVVLCCHEGEGCLLRCGLHPLWFPRRGHCEIHADPSNDGQGWDYVRVVDQS